MYRQRHRFLIGTFDLSNVTCKQHHSAAVNPFLKGTKTCDIDGACKRSLNGRSHGTTTTATAIDKSTSGLAHKEFG